MVLSAGCVPEKRHCHVLVCGIFTPPLLSLMIQLDTMPDKEKARGITEFWPCTAALQHYRDLTRKIEQHLHETPTRRPLESNEESNSVTSGVQPSRNRRHLLGRRWLSDSVTLCVGFRHSFARTRASRVCKRLTIVMMQEWWWWQRNDGDGNAGHHDTSCDE